MASSTRSSAGPGLIRQVEGAWALGMYRNGPPELIPADALYDAQNCLLDLLGGVFRRGGSSYRSTAAFGAGLRWLWNGSLTNGGETTLVASTTEYGKLEASGAVTALGNGGMSSYVGGAVDYEGKLYLPGGKTYDGAAFGVAANAASFYAIVANRLLAAGGSRVAFSKIGLPGTFEATDYHQLPGNATIIGMASGRESAVVFTTRGVWVISNMAMNLTDEKGNVQQRLDLYSHDLILWGGAGIAGWEGSLIVPGTDAVWLIGRGVSSELVKSFERISDSIRDLYREYVKAGYAPGQACVFENHYLLPIIGGGKVVDLLVCRLDMPPSAHVGHSSKPWTRLGGFGAQVAALLPLVSAGQFREPQLLGATYDASSRVLNCNYFQPSEHTSKDADGSVAPFWLETRGYTTGSLVPNTVTRLRVRYLMSNPEAPAPELQASVAGEAPVAGGSVWGAFKWGVGAWASAGAGTYEPLAGNAPQSLEGFTPYSWRLHKKRRFVRFRLTCAQATAQLSIRSLEFFIRPQGRL